MDGRKVFTRCSRTSNRAYRIVHRTVARTKPGRRAGKWLYAAMHAPNPREEPYNAPDSKAEMGSCNVISFHCELSWLSLSQCPTIYNIYCHIFTARVVCDRVKVGFHHFQHTRPISFGVAHLISKQKRAVDERGQSVDNY